MKYFIPAYMGGKKVFYVRKGERENLKKYEDLYLLKVSLLHKTKHYEPFDSDSKIKKITGYSVEANLRNLLYGHVDAVLVNCSEGIILIDKLNLQDKLEVAPYFKQLERNGFFAMSKKSKHLDKFNRIQNLLKKMVESGKVEKIIKRGLLKYNAEGQFLP